MTTSHAELLQASEVARILNCSVDTVRRLVKDGTLRAQRLTARGHLRFAPSDIDRYSEGQRMGAERRKDRDGWWYVRFEFTDPKTGETREVRRRAPANTKKSAEKLERELRDEISRNMLGKRRPIMFRDMVPIFEDWLEVEGKKPAYAADCESVIRNHLLPHFDRFTLAGIDAAEILAYKKAKKKLAPKTVNNHLGVLSKMLRLAVELGKLHTPPPKMNLLPVPQPKDPRWLKRDEATKLLRACKDQRLKTAVTVALHTGLRMGELEALRWKDVYETKLIVRRSYCQESRAFVAPKNGKTREVDLNSVARGAFEEYPKRLRCPLVFSTRTGRVWDKPEMSKELRRACKLAGVDPIGWHVLRHTFASWLVQAGVPLYEVSRLLGHSSLKQTEIYAHLSPRNLSDAVAALEG